MASKNSRTSRASAGGPTLVVGEQKIIIPLNDGKHAYVTVPGKTAHVATDSAAFVEAVTAIGAERAPKVRADLERLHVEYPTHGWDATLERLATAGAV